jgi:RHS repeat-associated protein
VAESYARSAAHFLKQYVWGLRQVDAPVLRDRETDGGSAGLDERLYYTQDGNFNVTALVNPAGQVVERYSYDAYGQVTVRNGAENVDPDTVNDPATEWDADPGNASDVDNCILYCGYRFDSETGLYHVRHRYLHPTLGRWTTQDPAGYVDGLSLYEYCRSGPVYLSDTSGLASKEAWKQLNDRDAEVMSHLRRHHPEDHKAISSESPVPVYNDTDRVYEDSKGNKGSFKELEKKWREWGADDKFGSKEKNASVAITTNTKKLYISLGTVDGRLDKWTYKELPTELDWYIVANLKASAIYTRHYLKKIGNDPVHGKAARQWWKRLKKAEKSITTDGLRKNKLGHALVYLGDILIRDGWHFPKVGERMRKPNALRGARSLKLIYGGGYPEHRRKMAYGPKGVKGKLCRCANDGDILKCLLDRKNQHSNKKHRSNVRYGGLDSRLRVAKNCITESVEAVESCCLSFKAGERPEAANLRSFIIQSYTDIGLSPPSMVEGDTSLEYLRKLRAWHNKKYYRARDGRSRVKTSWKRRAAKVRSDAVKVADRL